MDEAELANTDILDFAGAVVLVLDTQGRVRKVNRKACQLLGLPPGDLLGRDWFAEHVPEEHRARAREVFEELVLVHRGRECHYEAPILTANGTRRIIAWCHATFSSPEGKTLGTVSCGQDVTERAAREEEFRRREAQWRAILDATVDGIITINERGRILNFNSGACRIFGYSAKEILGRDISQLMPEPDSSNHHNYIQNYLESGKRKIIGIGREVFGKKKSGELFPLYLAVGEVELPGERLFTGIVRDLSNYKQMQDQLLRSENLAALGEMAATVAHEIKNPLASISGAIQVLQDTLDSKDPRRSVMDEILKQVERLDNTVRQLLILSKPWRPDRQDCDLRLVIRQVVRLFSDAERSGRYRFNEEGLSELHALVDPTLLEKVFLNLIQNSIEAMPDGGQIWTGLALSGKTAVVTISDDGPGLPGEIKERVFEPFVTSKSNGTGLGLPICRKIMEAHGGEIGIRKSSDQGTIIELRLPQRG